MTKASFAAWASKWFSASRKDRPVASFRRSIAFAGKSGCRLMPVPVAVPPSATSASSSMACCTRRMPCRICAAYPPNSWPRRTGVASIRWVRPLLSTSSNASALSEKASCSRSRAGSNSSCSARLAETCIAVGITSFDDCDMLTWSFGCTRLLPRSPPRATDAALAITSLAFMLVDVPLPVWKMSMTNSSSSSPLATRSAAAMMASACSSSSRPSSRLARAAACLIRPSAWMKRREKRKSLIGKLSTARCVWAP